MVKTRELILTRAALIAALYIALTVVLGYYSYGPIQVRISEALTILPIFFPEAIAGLFLGCLIANIFGGFGIYDIVFGSLLTLLAAFLTYLFRRKVPLAFLSPVLINGLGVPLYLQFLVKNVPYWLLALQITAGEAVSIFGLGSLVYLGIKKNLQPEEKEKRLFTI